MANHTLRGLFADIADAIRAKTGDSADIVADYFPTAIAAIPTGGSDLFDVTYGTTDANDILTAYNAGKTIRCVYSGDTYYCSNAYTVDNAILSTFVSEHRGQYKLFDVTKITSATNYSTITTFTRPIGTTHISISQNGTISEDVSAYATAEITTSVPQGLIGVQTGTITPASAYGTLEIAINGDVDYFIIMAEGFLYGVGGNLQIGFGVKSNSPSAPQILYGVRSSSSAFTVMNAGNNTIEFSTGKVTIVNQRSTSEYKAGVQYRWFAW